jgi:hypothetical protein
VLPKAGLLQGLHDLRSDSCYVKPDHATLSRPCHDQIPNSGRSGFGRKPTMADSSRLVPLRLTGDPRSIYQTTLSGPDYI